MIILTWKMRIHKQAGHSKLLLNAPGGGANIKSNRWWYVFWDQRGANIKSNTCWLILKDRARVKH